MLARIGLLLAVGAMMAAQAAVAGARLLLGFAWLWLRRALGVVLALLVLFAEWGWRPLAALLGQLRRLALVARLENWIQTLPPYGALAVFVVPTLLLLPLKILALYFVAHGQKLTALGLIAVAKLGGTALVARIFILTGPQLMRIDWFARSYNFVMPWKERLFAQIRASWAWRYGRMLKSRVKQTARRVWTRLRPQAARLVSLVRFQLRTWTQRMRG
jgi:hypothetical protein